MLPAGVGSAPQPSPGLLHHAAIAAAALMDRNGLLKLRFQRQGALRVLCYHGVCADELIGAPWVPSYFVGVSQFARHLEILGRFGPVLHLPDAIAQLGRGDWLGTAACAITFDDVAACSFAHAAPLLARHGIRASFYVTTGHVTSGRLFNLDVLRLLRVLPDLVPAAAHASLAELVRNPRRLKRLAVNERPRALAEAERMLRARLAPEIYATLRPLNWNEVRQLADAGHEIGGHTVDHATLTHQPAALRREQIRASVQEIEQRLGRNVLGFAYPNGGPTDFGAEDVAVLRELGLRYAVTTRTGSIRDEDVFLLPRVCIGRGHTPTAFALELSGLLDARRQRRQGWS